MSGSRRWYLALIIILTAIFLAARMSGPLARVHAQGEDTSQLLINVFNEAADSMGWDSVWRASPANVHSYENQTTLYLTVLVSKSDVFCGNRSNSAEITRWQTVEQASQRMASLQFERVEVFHGENAYRKTNIAPHGNYKFQEWFAWAMGNYTFVIADSFDCPAAGLPESELDPVPFSEAIYAAAVNHGLGQDSVTNPNPPISNPPEPNLPRPSEPDIQTLIDQISQLVSNPAVPISGAVAGTLLAALIAALGGAGQVPVNPTPPVRGPKPGDMDASGRVYSPVSGGWVSPQIYDYQKTWSEKGWRWNPATGRFEGQHGAINEKGQVMDDELGWVDQKSFAENQQMRAEGYVYDRNMGWQTPDKLRDIHIDQDALRQRSKEFSANKNAEIQKDVMDASQKRLQEYQDWLNQYEHKEQVLQNMDAAQDEFRRQRAIDNKLALKEFLLKSAASPVEIADAIEARLCPPIGEVYQAAYEGVKETASDIKGIYQGTYDAAKETASDLKDFYQGAYDGVKGAASDLKDFYKQAYDGVKETASDLKDFYKQAYDAEKGAAGEVEELSHLAYHDGIQEEISKKISGKHWDWLSKSTKPAQQGAEAIDGTLKDKSVEAASSDLAEKAMDLVVDQAEKNPKLIR